MQTAGKILKIANGTPTKLLVMACLSLCLITATKAQNAAADNSENNRWGVDSLLYEFYEKTEKRLFTKEFQEYNNKLYDMAEELGDRRMMAVSLCNTVRNMSRDTAITIFDLRIARNHAVDFAVSNNLTKYVFQAKRAYIMHFIFKKQYNVAREELYTLLEEIKEHPDWEPMVIDCYALAAVIYEQKKQWAEAYRNHQLVINKTIELKADTFNMSLRYYNLINAALNVGRIEQARSYLEKCRASIVQDRQYCYYYTSKLQCLIESKAPKNLVKKEFDRLDTIGPQYINVKQRNKIKMLVYPYLGEWEKYRDLLEKVGNEDTYDLLADCYMHLGDYKLACQYYHMHDSIKAIIHRADTQRDLEEFSVLLNVHELNNSNTELSQKVNSNRIKIIYLTLFILLILILGIFAYAANLKRQHKKMSKKNSNLEKLRQQLEKEKETAEDALRMKSSFIRTICHEVRTPMNAIAGFSELLAERTTDEETKVMAEQINNNTFDLLNIVNNMIDVADLETGHSPDLSTETFDIVELCQKNIDDVLKHLKTDASITISAKNPNLRVCTNLRCVQLIMWHTIFNAVKFSPIGVIKIEIAENEQSGTVSFSVSDMGSGIEHGKEEQIFDLFFKINKYSKGAGLGLTVCRLAAKRILGTVEIDKNYDKGCRITARFPKNLIIKKL